MKRSYIRTAAGCLAGGAALAAAGYAAYAGAAYMRYGHARAPRTDDEQDPLLDRFMPLYDIVERHHIRVNAPADVTLAAARDIDMQDSPVIRAVFTGRELMFGSQPPAAPAHATLISTALSLGWGVLADRDGSEIVFGAVTKPWEANPVFRDLVPREFIMFTEPDYVKIAWTLRADPIDEHSSIFRTETRAMATDAEARTKFRRYWALVSPGVALIRRSMLGPVRTEAERRAAELLAAPAEVG
jgi:hypothetical protein